MERRSRHSPLFMWAATTMAALLSQNLVIPVVFAMASSTLNDQKHYYSPTPPKDAGTNNPSPPSYGSGGHQGGGTPSHGTPSNGGGAPSHGTPSHGGGTSSHGTPSHDGGGKNTPSKCRNTPSGGHHHNHHHNPSTPKSPPSGKSGESRPKSPPSGGSGSGGYHNSPPTSPSIDPTPTTPSPPSYTPTPDPPSTPSYTPTPDPPSTPSYTPTPDSPPSGSGSSGQSGGYYNSPPTSPSIDPTPTTPSTPSYTPIPDSPSTPSYTPTPDAPTIDTPPTPIVLSPPFGFQPSTPPFAFDPNSPPFTCDYWRNHPGLIWGLVGFWGTVGGVFGVAGAPGGVASNMNLMQALSNTRNDGLGELYREGTAALLNSMVTKRFPYTTNQVKDSFGAALSSDKAAAAQAKLFKLANEGRRV
ncbi:unnamed protein product [Cuscuta epithymum]|uniref:Protodermal factor 1 n=1 Tax=Cuscuta epithymum TaxID=186058 RepID=A0AAV0D262_9ASTE|nr:unnamed protein product [Cuscuta epithymum]